MGALAETGHARLRVSQVDADGRPRTDAALEALRAECGADFTVAGEIGRTLNGRIVFLARDLKRDVLKAILLTPVAGQKDILDAEVAKELRDHAPNCSKCGARIRSSGRFCTSCGADVSGLQERWSPQVLRAAVQERAAERGFEIRDEIRIPGGRVYFATSRESGTLESLQIEETHDGAFALGATGMLRQLLAETTAPGRTGARP